MPLSRIEIRRRATAFAKEWADAANEDAEAKSFWDGFFQVYDLLLPGGLPSRRYVRFVPGLAFFVLTTAGPAPRRIYDWFGVECPSEQPGQAEAMRRINAERMGQLIHADAKVSRGRQ